MTRLLLRTDPLDTGAALRDPQRYERQIERLHARHLLTSRLYELEQRGVSLAVVVQNKHEVAELVARTVAQGQYELAPARVRRIVVDDKERAVYSLRLTDLIVHGAVTEILEQAMSRALSPRLYSYRKGRSWWTAVSAFARYVREHRRARPDPTRRGLFVLRRDVEAYTDSIPVGERSPLWRMVRGLLDERGSLREDDWRLILGTIRPEAFETPGRLFCPWRGVPTGLPIACALFNLYLSPLDQALDSIPGAFYARYSDDILFAHPDARVVQDAAATIACALDAMGLADAPEKRRDLYLTGAGRASAEWSGARPATAVPLLGCRVTAGGEVALNRKKVRRLLSDIERRAARAVRAAQPGDVEVAGRLVCAVVNGALARRADPFKQAASDLLRRAVTDREQLQQLDYWIARIVLRVLTGERSALAFRVVPYGRLRRDWKLLSLVSRRNRQGRGARA